MREEVWEGVNEEAMERKKYEVREEGRREEGRDGVIVEV